MQGKYHSLVSADISEDRTSLLFFRYTFYSMNRVARKDNIKLLKFEPRLEEGKEARNKGSLGEKDRKSEDGCGSLSVASGMPKGRREVGD